MNLIQHHGLRFTKPLRSKEYKGFIATKICMCCGSHEVQVHHAVYKSAGNSGSDLFCVPVCVVHHNEYHKLGRAGFERKYNLNIDERVWYYLAEYFHSKGLDLRSAMVTFLEQTISEL